METKGGYRMTLEAGCAALARARDLLWASLQDLWQQIRSQFKS
jgi:hypothetical protein